MARRPRIREISNIISKPPVMRVGEKGEISAQLLSSLNQFLREVAHRFNGFISFGGGNHASWSGNIDGQYIEITFPNVANTEMRIPHGLGRLPIGYWPVRKDRACNVYDGSDNTWGVEYMYVKCNKADAVVRLLII